MKTLRENEGFFCVQESGFPSGSSSPTAFDYTNTKQKIEQTKFFQEVIGSLTAVVGKLLWVAVGLTNPCVVVVVEKSVKKI